jgi:magnesium transporter
MNSRNASPPRAPYKAETAGHLAMRHVPMASSSDTVGSVCSRIRADGYDAIDLVLVVDSDGRYQGAVELRSVLEAEDERPIESLINATWPRIAPETDQEHAADSASAAGVAVLPVVAADGKPLGVVTSVVLLEVLAREHSEDVNRFVGILKDRADARHALEDPPLRRVSLRLPWLLIGLAMSTSATAIMASYETALRANVLIAVFIPAIVYLADAIGTQTEAIAVRGLSLRRRPLGQVLGRELATGAAIGLILGAISLVGIWIVFGNFVAGLGVGISLFAAGSLASAIGLILPWALARVGIDPAFGSGPVATILQDSLTIAVYFLVMTSLLPA